MLWLLVRNARFYLLIRRMTAHGVVRIGGGLLSGIHVSVVTSGANCLPHDVRQSRQRITGQANVNECYTGQVNDGLVGMHDNVREGNY